MKVTSRVLMTAVAVLFLSACNEEKKNITTAQQAVAGTLRDPSSAEFTDVVWDGSGVCGYVNGKNLFGAYVGKEPFYYSDITGPEIRSSIDGHIIEDMKKCIFDERFESCMTVGKNGGSETEMLSYRVRLRQQQIENGNDRKCY